MTLSLGIRLVILFPSLLFLIGFGFKSIMEKNGLKKIFKIDKEISKNLWLDFLFLLSFDSIFLIIANGLIIIFELQNIEIGIISIIVGVIFSMSLLIGSHIDFPIIGNVGIVGIFTTIGLELGYFWSIGIDRIIWSVPLDTILTLFTGIIGVSTGAYIVYYSIPEDASW